MHVAEVKKSSSASPNVQAKRQPFFNKEGRGSFFSESNQATQAFFNMPMVQPKLESEQTEEESQQGMQPLQGKFESTSKVASSEPYQKANRTGLPDDLKSGVENLSGYSMDDVNVHYNSNKPKQLNAYAYAQGTDIHLASGQEKHLPHEAWHVVQQKQGRVKSTMQMKGGANVNDDVGLEKEADVLGKKLTTQNVSSDLGNLHTTKNNTKQNIIQRKKVPTNFGEFETTKFEGYDDRGVTIILKFHPNESEVDAKKIALIQTIRTKTSGGKDYALDPNQAGRMVGAGNSGEGYYVDAPPTTNNPIYWDDKNLGPTEELKDTPQSKNTSTAKTELGVNTNYELGRCYKKKPTDTKKDKYSAGLWDVPKGGKNKGESKMFESTAVAIEGTDKDKYYGSVKWGYKMEGTDAAPTLTKIDITEASKGMPTANFVEPAKLWNVGKTQGTIKVIADPEATVLKGTGSGTEKLTKDIKLKQLQTVMWGKNPSIKAEVLKADGTGSGKIIYIKNSDVADVGDGNANKKLPLLDIYIVKAETVLKDSTPKKDTKLPYGTQVEILDKSHLYEPDAGNTDPYLEMIKVVVSKGVDKGTEGWMNYRLVR